MKGLNSIKIIVGGERGWGSCRCHKAANVDDTRISILSSCNVEELVFILKYSKNDLKFLSAWWKWTESGRSYRRRFWSLIQGEALCFSFNALYSAARYSWTKSLDILAQAKHSNCIRSSGTSGKMEGFKWNWCGKKEYLLLFSFLHYV